MFLPSSFIDISPGGSCPSNPTLATLTALNWHLCALILDHLIQRLFLSQELDIFFETNKYYSQVLNIFTYGEKVFIKNQM